MYEYDIIEQKIEDYITEHSSGEDEVLYRINRDTHLHNLRARMLSGPMQGRLLKMISVMISPDTVLDIGTFTAYSAICLTEGLKPNGRVYTLERNQELEPVIRKNIKLANKEKQIQLLMGDALQSIGQLDAAFDLVFIDADKDNYCNYYRLVKPMVRPGGFILADNVLWGRKVIDSPEEDDPETAGIVAFNKMVKEDQEVEKLMLPFRDGLYLIRKK